MEKALAGGIILLAGGSLFATSTILFLFVRYKNMRANFSFRLIAELCLADMIWALNHLGSSVSQFLTTDRGSSLCQVQAWITTYSRLSIVSWTTAIALVLYLNQIKREKMESISQKIWVFHMVCTFLPMIVATA